jgi:hypothetical protein
MPDDVILWAVYRPSREFPRSYCVRRWNARTLECIDNNLPLCIAPTLEGARSVIPPGMVRVVRAADDDPAIEESWV